MITVTMILFVAGCVEPHGVRTTSTVTGYICCFRRSSFTLTLGNSNIGRNFTSVISGCKVAGSSGLTTCCTNIYYCRLKRFRRTVSCLGGFSNSTIGTAPTTLALVNSDCISLNSCSGTVSCFRGTTGASGVLPTPHTLGGTNVYCRRGNS